MRTATPKILVEFSVLPKNKELLKQFLDANINNLISGIPETRRQLAALLKDILPDILQKMPEHACLIQNLPEREALSGVVKIQPQDTYAYHIGNALYELCDARHIRSVISARSSHQKDIPAPPAPPGSLSIHRDSLRENESDKSSAVGNYVAFSCPIN